MTLPPKALPPPQAEPWPRAASEQLARALAADHAGDLTTVLRLADEMVNSGNPSPALRAYRATLQARLGFTNDVESDLSRFVGPNTPPSVSVPLNTALAFNDARLRQFNAALERSEAVEQADFFDVANLLHWGEVLRRQGHFGQAADKFQEALARLPVSTSPPDDARRKFIAYERRLCQVEDGRAAGLQPELDARLASARPDGYWLLTSAAAALQKGNLPAAADVLTKARAVLPPAQFRALLDDYFFRSFGTAPEIKPFLTVASPAEQQARRASMDYFIDP